MKETELIKKLIDERRSTWGAVDGSAERIDYPAGQPELFFSHLPADFEAFYPDDWTIICWTNKLKRYKADMLNGSMVVEGETPETIQADIDRYTVLLNDYRAWVKYEQNKPEDEKRLLHGITSFSRF